MKDHWRNIEQGNEMIASLGNWVENGMKRDKRDGY